MKAYVKFAGMVIVSTIVMFIFKYFSTYKLDHVFFSETRAYMALLMGATMAIIMLAFMRNMLKNRKLNAGIAAGSLFVFIASYFYCEARPQ